VTTTGIKAKNDLEIVCLFSNIKSATADCLCIQMCRFDTVFVTLLG